VTRCSRLLLYICVLFSVVVVTSCSKPGPKPPGTEAIQTVNIRLNYNQGSCSGSSCTCTQSGSEGNENSGALAIVHGGWNIAWITSSNAPLEVKFLQTNSPPNTPFYDFVNPSGSLTSAPASGSNGQYWYYSSLSFNNITCNNPGQLGIIMR